MEDAIALLKDMLAIPSVNGADDEGKVAEYLCEYMRTAGIAADVQRIDGKHANVIASLEGEDASRATIWNGHLDTVPYGEAREWEYDPATPVLENGYLYGRGASDMKSGLAAMVYALCSFRREGKRPSRTVRFLGTCDEEKGGLGAKKILEAGLMENAGELLIGEPTGCALGVAQKGCIWLDMTVGGRTSHGAYPWEGINAVEQGVEIASELKAYVESFTHPILGHATAQITQIAGGVAPNMTPDACALLLDIRVVPGLDAGMVTARANAIAGRRGEELPGLYVRCEVKNDRRAIEIATDHQMVRRMKEKLSEMGLKGREIGINYFTDASVLAADRPDMAVLLFGPGEPDMAHKPNERVAIDKYMQSIEILRGMIP